jgi:hypothetical protein
LKNDFKNLGIVLYSTEMFSGKICSGKLEKRRRRIYEKGH